MNRRGAGKHIALSSLLSRRFVTTTCKGLRSHSVGSLARLFADCQVRVMTDPVAGLMVTTSAVPAIAQSALEASMADLNLAFNTTSSTNPARIMVSLAYRSDLESKLTLQ